MKRYIILGLIVVVLVAVSFSFREADPDIEGLIYSKSSGQILVVAGIDDVDLPYDVVLEQGSLVIAFSVTEKTIITGSEGKKITFTELQEGDQVKVWHTGSVRESYPLQADARKIVVIN